MYIYNFLQSIKLLKGLDVPRFNDFPYGEIIYYNYAHRKKFQDKIDIKGNYFLAYSRIDENPDQIKYVNIDHYIKYIHKLEREKFKIIKCSLNLYDGAILEAVWLFDMFSKIERDDHPFIDIEMYDGAYTVQKVNSKYGIGDVENILPIFDNNPIKRDIFMAQFIYFSKMYIMARINKDCSQTEIMHARNYFKINLFNMINKYVKEDIHSSQFNWYKSQIDSEFDNFIQQVNELSKREKKKYSSINFLK